MLCRLFSFNLALIIIQSDGLRDLKEAFFHLKQEVIKKNDNRPKCKRILTIQV